MTYEMEKLSSGPHWNCFDFHIKQCGLTTALPLPPGFLRVGGTSNEFYHDKFLRFYVLILRFQSQAFTFTPNKRKRKIKN